MYFISKLLLRDTAQDLNCCTLWSAKSSRLVLKGFMVVFPNSFMVVFPNSFMVVFPNSFMVVFPNSFMVVFPNSF